jgi:hypothetical protein
MRALFAIGIALTIIIFGAPSSRAADCKCKQASPAERAKCLKKCSTTDKIKPPDEEGTVAIPQGRGG